MADDESAADPASGPDPGRDGPPWPPPQGPAVQPAAPPQAGATQPMAPPQGWPVPAGPPAWSTPPPAAPTAEWARPAGPSARPSGAPDPWAAPLGPRVDPPTSPYPWGTPPPTRDRTGAFVVAGIAGLLVVALAAALLVWGFSRDGTSAAGPGPAPGTSAPADGSPGDQSPAPSATGPRTPASREIRAYIDSANEYCRTTTDPRLKEILGLARTDPEQFFRDSAKITRDLDGFLRRGVPGAIAGDVKEMTDHWDQLATSSQRAAETLAAGDAVAAAQHIEEGSAANEAGNTVARRIGLTDCADAGGLGGPGPGTPGPTTTV